MKKILAVAAIAILAAPSVARAQERAGSAALGAVSGALVLGPVGAVAGAVVGFTAGPSIARAWGLRSEPAPRRATKRTPSRQQATERGTATATEQANARVVAPPAGPKPQTATRAAKMPPVQAFE